LDAGFERSFRPRPTDFIDEICPVGIEAGLSADLKGFSTPSALVADSKL